MTREEPRRIGSWLAGTLRAADRPADRWVVKFGGSLLTRPDWPRELADLVAGLPGAVTVVVGGGPLVNGLRAIDAACPRPVMVMDALAIEAMGITARLVAEATGLPLVAASPAAAAGGILDAPVWLAAPGRRGWLPVGWHVTSDSIAAVVATDADAVLMLAKCVRPPTTDLAALAAAGWVDAHMPQAAARLAAIHWAAPDDPG